MKIESLEQIKELVKLCRTLNVERIEIDGIKLELGAAKTRKKKANSEQSEIDTNELTPDQLLFWSSDPGAVDG